jgi:hypothetical protein
MDASNVIVDTDRHEWVSKTGLGALSLLAANAGLLLLYFVYDLTLFQLVVVLWVECLWIGFYSAIKLLTASIIGSPYENKYVHVTRGSSFLMSLLAIFFVTAQFIAIFGATGIAIFFIQDTMSAGDTSDFVMDDLGVVVLGSMLFFVGHGISYVVNFIVLGEYKSATFGQLLTLPFKRCLGLFFSIALTGGVLAFAPQFATTTLFAVLLLTMKVLWDYRLHVKEREALRRAESEGSSAT